MKNKDVIFNFLNRIPCSSSTGSLSSTGDCLYSYSTCIAEFDNHGRLWYNNTRYSNTTSHHQSYLRIMAPKIYATLEDIPRNTVHIIR